MPSDLVAELKQSKPFACPELELYLSLVRTTDLLSRKPSSLLKEKGLSHAQYNVLRILRGAGPEGLPCGEIGSRMVTRDPDVTRLLDRLEQRKLVARGRSTADRRVVTTHITEGGLALIKAFDQSLANLHKQQLAFLGTKTVQTLL